MSKDYFDDDLEPDAALAPAVDDDDTPDDNDTTKALASPVSASEPVSGNKPEKKNREFLGQDLKTLLIGGVGILAALTYLAWPESAPVSHGLIAETPQQQGPASPAETEAEPEWAPAPVAPPVPEMTAQAAPAPDTAPPAEPTASLKAVSELETRQDSSETRIAALEARLNSLEQARQTASSGTTATAKPRTATPPRQTTPARSTPVSRTPTAPRQTAPNVSIKDWQIHSVYPGMAWLTLQDSTHAVRPGDTVRGLTIQSIHADKREVHTSHGIIRGR